MYRGVSLWSLWWLMYCKAHTFWLMWSHLTHSFISPPLLSKNTVTFYEDKKGNLGFRNAFFFVAVLFTKLQKSNLVSDLSNMASIFCSLIHTLHHKADEPNFQQFECDNG